MSHLTEDDLPESFAPALNFSGEDWKASAPDIENRELPGGSFDRAGAIYIEADRKDKIWPFINEGEEGSREIMSSRVY